MTGASNLESYSYDGTLLVPTVPVLGIALARVVKICRRTTTGMLLTDGVDP